jgi:hypothetical protein
MNVIALFVDAVFIKAGSYVISPKSSASVLTWRKSIARTVPFSMGSVYDLPVRLSLTVKSCSVIRFPLNRINTAEFNSRNSHITAVVLVIGLIGRIQSDRRDAQLPGEFVECGLPRSVSRGTLPASLDQQRFSVFAIVNIEALKKLQPGLAGTYGVELKNGTKLRLSRGYRERFFEKFGHPSQ